MANLWLRLWHDMPNDPKWKTISRISGEPIALVISTYVHLLVDASRNVTRGHVTVTVEDLASALDVQDDQIIRVLDAMNGRVIENGYLTGWDSRQVKKEDAGNEETGAKSATERKRAQRERAKKNNVQSGDVTNVTNVTESVTCHEDVTKQRDSVCDTLVDGQHEMTMQLIENNELSRMSRDVTTDKIREDKSITTGTNVPVVGEVADMSQPADKLVNCPHDEILAVFAEKLPELPQPVAWGGNRADALRSRWRWVLAEQKRKNKPHDKDAGIDFFRRLFGYISQSDFLMGRAGKWQADLGWIVKAENFAKILQGNYENKDAA